MVSICAASAHQNECSCMSALEPRIWPRNTALSHTESMTFGGVDVKDLARDYGTPLFVVDELDVRSRAREFVDAFNFEDLNCTIHYASKAFSSADVLRWVSAEGLGVDVSTGGELGLALAAGIPARTIVLHGNNKSVSELQRGIEAGIGAIVIDSFDEIERLAQLTRLTSKSVDVFLRLTLGVEAHTHEFIATAHEDQKFGLSVNSGAAEQAALAVLAVPGLRLRGFHSHIGSQIFDPAGFEAAAERAINFIAHMLREHEFVTEHLDLGGGLGLSLIHISEPTRH